MAGAVVADATLGLVSSAIAREVRRSATLPHRSSGAAARSLGATRPACPHPCTPTPAHRGALRFSAQRARAGDAPSVGGVCPRVPRPAQLLNGPARAARHHTDTLRPAPQGWPPPRVVARPPDDQQLAEEDVPGLYTPSRSSPRTSRSSSCTTSSTCRTATATGTVATVRRSTRARGTAAATRPTPRGDALAPALEWLRSLWSVRGCIYE